MSSKHKAGLLVMDDIDSSCDFVLLWSHLCSWICVNLERSNASCCLHTHQRNRNGINQWINDFDSVISIYWFKFGQNFLFMFMIIWNSTPSRWHGKLNLRSHRKEKQTETSFFESFDLVWYLAMGTCMVERVNCRTFRLVVGHISEFPRTWVSFENRKIWYLRIFHVLR